MVSIRLSRVGKKNHPLFRIVVQDKKKDPYGPALDYVGFYNPHTSPSTVDLKVDLIKDWISKGAQPSNTVWNLLVNAGVVEGKKRKSVKLDPKAIAAAEEEAKEAAATAEAEEAPAEEKPAEEAPKEGPKEEAPAEAPAEEAPKEEKLEEPQQEEAAE